ASSLTRWVLLLSQTACLLFTAGALVLEQSRGAWAGFTVAIVGVALWTTGNRRLWIAAASIVMVAALAFGPRMWQDVQRPSKPPALASGVVLRLELWSKAVIWIGDFPLTGMGMNMFRTRMRILYPVFVHPPDPDVVHAHNNLLQAAVDLGIPGLIAYL